MRRTDYATLNRQNKFRLNQRLASQAIADASARRDAGGASSQAASAGGGSLASSPLDLVYGSVHILGHVYATFDDPKGLTLLRWFVSPPFPRPRPCCECQVDRHPGHER